MLIVGYRLMTPPDKEGSRFPLNVGKSLAGFMESHPRQLYSAAQLTVGSPQLLSVDTVDDTGQVTYRYTLLRCIIPVVFYIN